MTPPIGQDKPSPLLDGFITWPYLDVFVPPLQYKDRGLTLQGHLVLITFSQLSFRHSYLFLRPTQLCGYLASMGVVGSSASPLGWPRPSGFSISPMRCVLISLPWAPISRHPVLPHLHFWIQEPMCLQETSSVFSLKVISILVHPSPPHVSLDNRGSPSFAKSRGTPSLDC